MSCSHASTTEGAHYGYSGDVSVYPYTASNPAAHGCVRYTQTCTSCGARRNVNQNQLHHEYGTWGVTLEQRQQAARSARRSATEALRQVGPLEITHRDGRVAIVSVDNEGYLNVEGARWEDVERAVSRSAWLARAKAARRDFVAAAHLLEEQS